MITPNTYHLAVELGKQLTATPTCRAERDTLTNNLICLFQRYSVRRIIEMAEKLQHGADPGGELDEDDLEILWSFPYHSLARFSGLVKFYKFRIPGSSFGQCVKTDKYLFRSESIPNISFEYEHHTTDDWVLT